MLVPACTGVLVLSALVPAATGSPAPASPCSTGRALPEGPTGTLGHGSWSWFADPRAVNLGSPYDESFAGWIDWRGDVTVGAIDPACDVEQTAVLGRLFHDDHGAPAILVEPNDRLTVFWSGHNGRAMYYRSTLRAADISAWTPVRVLHSHLSGGDGFTYPNPVMLGDQLYFFWRGSDYSADFATRAADGTWSPARRVILNPGQRPYVKVASDGRSTIALAYTNGHPRETTTSIYYAAYRAGWLRHAGGRPIAMLGSGPIAPRRGDLVYDGSRTHVSAWVWDVALDHHARPVIVYATFPSPRDQLYWYARWNGRRWTSRFVTHAGPTISPGTIETEYSGGITLDHADPSTVFLSRKVRGRFEIEQWRTGDAGRSWHHTVVARSADAGSVRPVVPRGPAGPVKLLWLRGPYRSYTTYRTSVAYLR